MSAPRTVPGIDRQPAGAGSVFILNSHRCAHRARSRHIASKPDKIWMRDNSIVDIDGEIVSRIAAAPSGRENKFPGSIKGRPCLRRGSDRDEKPAIIAEINGFVMFIIPHTR